MKVLIRANDYDDYYDDEDFEEEEIDHIKYMAETCFSGPGYYNLVFKAGRNPVADAGLVRGETLDELIQEIRSVDDDTMSGITITSLTKDTRVKLGSMGDKEYLANRRS